MIVIDEATGAKRTTNVRIQYESVPKYCTECKLQGHNDEGCRKLHPNLRNTYKKPENRDATSEENSPVRMSNKFPPKVLSSGKVVGDPDAWAIVKGGKPAMEKKSDKSVNMTTKEKVNISNQFDLLKGKTEGLVEDNSTATEGKQCRNTTKQWVQETFKKVKWGDRVDIEQILRRRKVNLLSNCNRIS